MISAAQCRAARALIDWSSSRLAAASDLSVDEITSFERNGDLDALSIRQIAKALEAAGVRFLAERRGRGAGVRFKFGAQIAKRIDIWENEGGPVAEDDVI